MRPSAWLLPTLAVLLVLVALTSMTVGAVETSAGQVITILARPFGFELPWPSTHTQQAVVLYLRLPRVILGSLVGAALAVAGAATQGLFRNPLADPGLIGIAAGAALAVVTTIVIGDQVPVMNSSVAALLNRLAVPTAAFVGALATTFIVYRLSLVSGRTVVAMMLLAGIGINALAGSATGLLVYLADDQELRSVTFWTLGSLAGASWPSLSVAGPIMFITVLVLPRFGLPLNAMVLGESAATHLGIDVQRTKRMLVTLVALGVGAAVSVAGMVGFIGLVVPHLLRLTVGPDHRRLLPASALLGASLTIGADSAARTLVSPAELPLGILTALCGAPFLLWLLRSERRQGYL